MGILHSEETKKKLSIIKKGKRKGLDSHMTRIILNKETGIFYIGIKEAAITINVKYSTLLAWLNGSNKNKSNFMYT